MVNRAFKRIPSSISLTPNCNIDRVVCLSFVYSIIWPSHHFPFIIILYLFMKFMCYEILQEPKTCPKSRPSLSIRILRKCLWEVHSPRLLISTTVMTHDIAFLPVQSYRRNSKFSQRDWHFLSKWETIILSPWTSYYVRYLTSAMSIVIISLFIFVSMCLKQCSDYYV